MPKLDISKAADFSIITQASLASTVALFGGRNPNEWDIIEASYNGVLFHVFETKTSYQGAVDQITGEGGRRKVIYKYPYRDGQTTDDLGREGQSFNFNILIHGLRYMEGYQALMTEFNKPTPGKLLHPVRGEIQCVIHKWTEVFKSDTRKAVGIQATFIEHNFTIGDIRQLRDSSVSAALSAALGIFKIITAALQKIEAALLLVQQVKNLLSTKLSAYSAANAITLTQMNSTFNSRGGSATIPSLVPTNQGGTRNTDGTVSSDTFTVVRTPSDPFNAIPVADLEDSSVFLATAVNNLTKQVIARREELADILTTIYEAGNNAELELYDTIVELKQTAVLLQEVLEKGAASSNIKVLDYTVPRVMSLREVAFLNGIDVNRVGELDLLNPSLLSTNYIEKDTVVKVPIS